jgi:hypothetical protein
MKKSGHNGSGHVTETPDVSNVRNIDVTHEASDVNIGGILTFVVVLSVMLVAVTAGLILLFNYYNAEELTKESESKPGPMAMKREERLPPEPRPQAAPGFGVKLENGEWVKLENSPPETEYQIVRKQWDQVLRDGRKDQAGNLIGMPIDQAMKQITSPGALPIKPMMNAPNKLEDYAIAAPTAASSGRLSERVR